MKRVLALIATVCFVAGACGGDDDMTTPGSGGASGSGAGGTVGTSAGSGGSGPSTGGASDASRESSGAAGDGGTGDNADANDIEAASIDVSDAVSSGSDAGEGASDEPDSAREGPESSEGSLPDGDATATLPKFCAQSCSGDGDCANDSGVQKARCHPDTHRCSTCIDDMPCVAARSLWVAKTCTLDAECPNEGGFAPFGDVCIDVGGTGYCAFLATSMANCTSFLNTSQFSTFAVKKYGSDARVDVCGKPSRCDGIRGSCQNPCTSSTSCSPARGGKVCNTTIGKCECASDNDCGPGAPICNLAIQQCECGSQADCSADAGGALVCQ